MTAPHHPIRDAELHVFQRCDEGDKGPRYMARFYPYTIYPVFFHGATEGEAVERAEALRTEAIEKHEQTYISRQIALEKARAARDAKKAETAP